MDVSIIVLNFNHPEHITRLLPTLQTTTGVEYETVVVDNGSEPAVVERLKEYKAQGMIDTLVLEPENNYFSEGNNIGVRHSDPSSEFILLLNNDTEILRSDWLERMLEWAEGTPEVFYPYAWTTHPTKPKNERKGIVSFDYCWNENVPSNVTPDGWCCLIRREAWREMDPNFPMAFGIMKMLASAIKDGHRAGVLSQFGHYIRHFGQGSSGDRVRCNGKPDMVGWWEGAECETLDFTLGEHEHESYMGWSHRIGEEYKTACDEPTDINEHMPTLYNLAKECDSVVEGGVRYVVSTWAWIWGCICRGGKVESYCWTKIPEIERAIEICRNEGLPWNFHDGDWLTQEIPSCDLLFIDTNHFYCQLKQELRLHGPKARKYIVLHDTENFGTVGADGKTPGLWQAVLELVEEGEWRVKKHYHNCNGLTVLERVNV